MNVDIPNYRSAREWLDGLDVSKLPPPPLRIRTGIGMEGRPVFFAVHDPAKYVAYLKTAGDRDDSPTVLMGTWQDQVQRLKDFVESCKSGKSIADAGRKILIIDIETTGFQGQGGSIVEVGAVSLNLDTGKVETVIDSVCRESMLTDAHSEEPLGWIFSHSDLTMDMVKSGIAFDDLRSEIQDSIDDHPLGATSYNLAFDFDFLESRGIKFGRKLPCPMKIATPVYRLAPFRRGQYKWPKVEEAWHHFFPDREYVEKHRAADDAAHEALIVLELYRQGLFIVGDQPPPASIATPAAKAKSTILSLEL